MTYHICSKFKSEGTKVCKFYVQFIMKRKSSLYAFWELSRGIWKVSLVSVNACHSVSVIQYNTLHN